MEICDHSSGAKHIYFIYTLRIISKNISRDENFDKSVEQGMTAMS